MAGYSTPAPFSGANTEAGQITVPMDDSGAFDLECMGDALGEFEDTVCHESYIESS